MKKSAVLIAIFTFFLNLTVGISAGEKQTAPVQTVPAQTGKAKKGIRHIYVKNNAKVPIGDIVLRVHKNSFVTSGSLEPGECSKTSFRYFKGYTKEKIEKVRAIAKAKEKERPGSSAEMEAEEGEFVLIRGTIHRQTSKASTPIGITVDKSLSEFVQVRESKEYGRLLYFNREAPESIVLTVGEKTAILSAGKCERLKERGPLKRAGERETGRGAKSKL